jgi:hypothetical protein
MPKKILVVAALGLGTIVWLVIISPPARPQKSIDISVTELSVISGIGRVCTVQLSNVSNCHVQFAGGFGRTWYETEFLTNGTWEYGKVRTPGGGDQVLKPCQAITEIVEVPEGIYELRIGLSITSLTWRGQTAWHLYKHFPAWFRPLRGYLLVQDERKRSTVEWSGRYVIRDGRVTLKP